MTTINHLFDELPPDRRRQLTDIAVEVSLPRATRLFEEGRMGGPLLDHPQWTGGA